MDYEWPSKSIRVLAHFVRMVPECAWQTGLSKVGSVILQGYIINSFNTYRELIRE